MIELTDQLGSHIILEHPAKRIVSLVPSQTELLYDLGLEKETVGITKFCIHPGDWFQSKTRVGGTKNVHLYKIQELGPDLIIANKEENTKEDIETLRKHFQVYVSDIITIEDALVMIKHVGLLSGTEQKAVDLIDDIQDDLPAFPKFGLSAIYLIWKDPYMACGTSNFIDTMMSEVGLTNLIKAPRYIEISLEEIKRLSPDVILLSTEPYPFKEEQCQELEKELGVKVRLVDGEMFSWYGSRMKKMKSYFRGLQL